MKQRGFTLLEMLISLVLMSLLIVALFGGFRAGIASWRVAENHIERTEPQLLLSRMMYRHLSQVRMYWSGPSFGKDDVSLTSFRGLTDSLRYVAPLAQSVDDQLYVVELANRPAGEPGVWIKYVPYKTLSTIEEELDQAEYQLVSAELNVRFSYFVNDEWMDGQEPVLEPVLVRVQWESDEHVWSDSVFAVERG